MYLSTLVGNLTVRPKIDIGWEIGIDILGRY